MAQMSPNGAVLRKTKSIFEKYTCSRLSVPNHITVEHVEVSIIAALQGYSVFGTISIALHFGSNPLCESRKRNVRLPADKTE